MWRGDLTGARTIFRSLLAQADERGETESHLAIRLQLCELELRAARWDVAANLLGEWEREASYIAGHSAALHRCQALVAAGRGESEEARRQADAAIADAAALGLPWHRLEALRARGLAELLAGEPAAACRSLREVWEHTRRVGIENPGAFPVAPELVWALAAAGEVDEARTVCEALARQVSAQDHLWGCAGAAVARGHLLLAIGDFEAAVRCLTDGAARYLGLGFPFDQARALTALGIAHRRLRQRREAASSLEWAAAIFDDIGSPGWAELAREELGRIGGRRAGVTGELTATESRVAQLVARGMTNKEVAAVLTVTVGAVEAHLTRIYAKLGVRSRTELARKV
jgi:DNA-binding CsgD family transcriptional regulator